MAGYAVFLVILTFLFSAFGIFIILFVSILAFQRIRSAFQRTRSNFFNLFLNRVWTNVSSTTTLQALSMKLVKSGIYSTRLFLDKRDTSLASITRRNSHRAKLGHLRKKSHTLICGSYQA